MEIKKKKTIKFVLTIVLLIIILLLWWLFLGGSNVFAKYNREISSNSITEVAMPVFIVDGVDDIKIDGIKDTTYNFSVKNFDEKETSEVDLDYQISIENNSKADLDFTLTKDGQTVSLSNNKTNTITLSNSGKQSDNYTLSIKYNNNPAITEDITGDIQIKVEAVQAKK